jgi:hypothetical protein
VTEDAFEDIAATDRPPQSPAARIAELFGSEPHRLIVD